jgi:hypothetical protein
MIDNATILFTTLLAVYVIYRAAKLNRILPWFETKTLYEQRMRQEASKPLSHRLMRR